MRLFVGIDIDDEIRARIAEYVAGLQGEFPFSRAKWVRPESMHVTLKFIGESNKLAEIQRVLSEVHSQPIEIAFRKVGFFTPLAPRVFWAGVEASELLRALANHTDSSLAGIGIPRETHEYTPHLTLARVGSGKPQGDRRDRNKSTLHELKARVESLPQPEFGTMLAKKFNLYQSETLPSGPRYTKLGRFELRNQKL